MKFYLVEIKNPIFPKPSYHNWGDITQEEFDEKIKYWTYPDCSVKLLEFESESDFIRKKFEILGNAMQIYSII